MSRKDTILVAVVVNAALLIVLFISAIKKDKGGEYAATSVPVGKEEVVELSAPKKEEKVAAGDEIDQVLREFSKKQAELQKRSKNKEVVAETGEKPLKSDFVKDLKALTTNTSGVSKKKVPSGGGNIIEVTVKKGDALSKLARTYQTTIREIMQLNNMTQTNLRIGQVLKVKSNTRTQKQASQTPSNAAYYVVKNGDNPWTIAVKNHMKVDELLKLNDLDDQKARRLKPGDRLRIR